MRGVLVAAALLGAGCATGFFGNAKIETGPAGCEAVCQGWGMELAGMVQMGEYSNGCICQVKGRTVAVKDAAAAALPAVAGVWTAMQRRQMAAAVAQGIGSAPAGLTIH